MYTINSTFHDMVWYNAKASKVISVIFVFLKHLLISLTIMINVFFIIIFDYYGVYDYYVWSLSFWNTDYIVQ